MATLLREVCICDIYGYTVDSAWLSCMGPCPIGCHAGVTSRDIPADAESAHGVDSVDADVDGAQICAAGSRYARGPSGERNVPQTRTAPTPSLPSGVERG